MSTSPSPSSNPGRGWHAAIFLLGPVLAVVAMLTLPASYVDSDGSVVELSRSARAVMGVGLWMAAWWLAEVVALPITALLPLAVLPLCTTLDLRELAGAYAHPLVFLFLGGFLLSAALQKWGLHRRIAWSIAAHTSGDPTRLVGGFMLATAFLSMWLSNTATAIMMMPIALSVLDRSGDQNLARCLLLGVAYSASIGGMATLVGTPPNLFVAGYLADQLGREVSFATWLVIGLPVAALLLPATWWYLTRVRFRIARGSTAALEGDDAGFHWSLLDRGSRATLVVFACAASAWTLRPWLVQFGIAGVHPLAGLTDTGVAMLAALALFVIPIDLRTRRFVLQWDDTRDLPWGTLILFGGGLALAAAIAGTGVDRFIAASMVSYAVLPPWLVVGLIVASVVFLTELTSNIATTATLVPVLVASAPALGLDAGTVPVMVALAASCAFMMPVATPPNAIVFGTGQVRVADMVQAGIVINLAAIVLITVAGLTIIPRVLGP